MTLTRGHVLKFGLAILLALAVYLVNGALEASLWEPAYMTGWVLLAGMLILTLLNARKKLPFMPLMNVRSWVRLHVYLGWFVLAVFLIHLDFEMPNGGVETAMAVLFVIVGLSGVVGAWLSRSFPRRLTRRGEEVIYERIPMFIAQLREAADDLATYSVEQTESTSIADFYAKTLKSWFSRPADFLQHLFERNNRQYALEQEIVTLRRYLNSREQEILDELQAMVRKKSDLDYHYALQKTLKAWLFVHIPATYALLVLAGVHVVLVHAFTGAQL